MKLEELNLPVSEGQFQVKYGESVLSEFVHSHEYSGLIDELVQNDYDAKSPKSIIEFGQDRLISRGFGDPIDEPGWQRLQIVMGTGKDVPPKLSLLGIKNQGLRALFLLGDFIVVRSSGCFTVLSLEHGCLKERQKDVANCQATGTVIEIPYRSVETNGLPVFTTEKEVSLMKELETALPLKLGMLPTPMYKGLMNTVIVVSKRTGVTLTCKQAILSEGQSVPIEDRIQRRITLEIRRI